MAGSLDVIRQAHRITSPAMTPPGHYHNAPPTPPSSQRRLVGPARFGVSAPPPLVQKGKALPVGMAGRHSWTGNASSTGALLSNRFNRLSLRLSAPTPGEEELCRHWMQNSAKYCRRHKGNQIHMATIRSNANLQQQKNVAQLVGGQSKQFERPRTEQGNPSSYRRHDMSPALPLQRVHSAGPRRIVVNMAMHNEYMTSSESERITSPSASQRSSPSPATRKLMKQNLSSRRPTSSNTRVNSASGGGRDVRTQPRPHTSQPRPPSARPSEIRWRSRVRGSGALQETRPHSGGPDMPPRRWSFNDNIISSNNDVTKDDDSAYSSSRDITINIENGHVTPKPKDGGSLGVGDVFGSPPRSANSNRVNSGRSAFFDKETNVPVPDKQRHHADKNANSEVKGHDSKVKLSNQGGHSVFYYQRHNVTTDPSRGQSRMISIDDNGPPFTRHNPVSYGRLLPLRHSHSNGRPVTQPAMGPPHARTSLKRKSNDIQRLQKPGNDVTQRILPQSLPVPGKSGNRVQYHVGPKFHPISVSDYDAISKQQRPGPKDQRQVTSHPDLQPTTPYINTEVSQRVVEWLASVEQNPEVYYGFETDLIGI